MKGVSKNNFVIILDTFLFFQVKLQAAHSQGIILS